MSDISTSIVLLVIIILLILACASAYALYRIRRQKKKDQHRKEKKRIEKLEEEKDYRQFFQIFSFYLDWHLTLLKDSEENRLNVMSLMYSIYERFHMLALVYAENRAKMKKTEDGKGVIFDRNASHQSSQDSMVSANHTFLLAVQIIKRRIDLTLLARGMSSKDQKKLRKVMGLQDDDLIICFRLSNKIEDYVMWPPEFLNRPPS